MNNFNATTISKRKKRKREDVIFRSAMQSFAHGEGMDPLILMAHVIGERAMREETLVGDMMYSTLLGILSEEDEEEEGELNLEGFYCMAKSEMLRITSEKACSVRSIPKLKLLTDPVPKFVCRGKKKDAIEEFLKKCELARITYSCASMVQLVYTSGARVQELYSHPSEFLISCREKILNDHSGVISLVEVPNSLQLLHCFYVDWDMLLKDFKFLFDDMPTIDKKGIREKELIHIDYVRSEAMKTPKVICDLLIKLGYIDSETVIQVAVVEGTRWNEKKNSHKMSIHFIFKILMTRNQYKKVWSDLLDDISSNIPSLGGSYSFDDIIKKREDGIVDSETLKSMGSSLFPLIGMDIHPFHNIEQGLALPFSRKTPSDPVSRPIAIIHLKNGEEIMWEVPCRDLWRAGKNILLNKNHPEIKGINVSPSSLLSCLHDCSICVPSYRCIGIVFKKIDEKNSLKEITHHNEELEETSRCSISSALSFASTTIISSSSKNRGREDGLKRMNQSLRSKMKSFSLNKISLKTSSKNLPVKNKKEEEDDDFVSRMPEWFVKAAKEYCGDDVFNSSNVYKTPRYGSRPSFTLKEEGMIFQMNKSPMAVCCRSLMRVPFECHKSHANNGSIFYVDESMGEVYVSCMKKECCSILLKDRERYFFMALKLRKFIIEGEDFDSSLTDYCKSKLTGEDLEFLRSFEKKSSPRLEDYVMASSLDMHNSLDGNRTWVKLNDRTFRSHLSFISETNKKM